MSRLSDRIAKMETAAGMGHDAVEEIHIMLVDATPDGPRYTGDVLIWPIGQPEAGQRWERREELAGAPANDAKARIRP